MQVPVTVKLVRPEFSESPEFRDRFRHTMQVAAKLSHLHNLPQGQAERGHRTLAMVTAMDAAGFGNCSNHYECEAACPKDISRDVMALLNRDYAKAALVSRDREDKSDGAG